MSYCCCITDNRIIEIFDRFTVGTRIAGTRIDEWNQNTGSKYGIKIRDPNTDQITESENGTKTESK